MKSLSGNVVLVILTCLLFPVISPGAEPGPDRDVIYQVAPIQSLSAGVYEGTYPFSRLKLHGDIGIGTFNALDGEMICLEGAFYRVGSEGRAVTVPDSALTPFAVVTFFDEDERFDKISAGSMTALCSELDKRLRSLNLFYVVRIDGLFDYIKIRSVPAQTKPYKPLLEAVKNQAVFEHRNVQGSLVGFRCPSYVEQVNVPGYHFHFITADRKVGGHVLELRFKGLDARVDKSSELSLVLPESDDFVNAALGGGEYRDLKKIE